MTARLTLSLHKVDGLTPLLISAPLVFTDDTVQ